MKRKRTTSDKHHLFGAANSPEFVAINVCDHRAYLSTAQRMWPRATLENKDGSPLLTAAAKIRGFCDFICYLMEKHIRPIDLMIELMDKGTGKR